MENKGRKADSSEAEVKICPHYSIILHYFIVLPKGEIVYE